VGQWVEHVIKAVDYVRFPVGSWQRVEKR